MKKKLQRGSLNDFLSGKPENYQHKEFVFKLIAPSLPQGNSVQQGLKGEDGLPARRGINTIQACGTIDWYDPATKIIQQRKIRYYKGAKSIFVDEQPNDKDFPKKKTSIVFENDLKIVKGSDSVLLNFMLNFDLCANKPSQNGEHTILRSNRDETKRKAYYLVDTVTAVKNYMDNDRLMAKAKTFVWEGDYHEVMSYARLKGCDMNCSEEEIRAQLIAHIDPRNPAKFLEDKENPSMLRKFIIQEAIEKGFIILNEANRTIAWATNPSQPLIKAALHLDPTDEFVKATFTPDGEEIYSVLSEMVSPKKRINKIPLPSKEELTEAAKVNVDPILKGIVETDEQIEQMLNMAVAKGIIAFKKPFWYEYLGKNRKKADFILDIKTGGTVLNALKEDLEKVKKAEQV